jgi:hypothetical protein
VKKNGKMYFKNPKIDFIKTTLNNEKFYKLVKIVAQNFGNWKPLEIEKQAILLSYIQTRIDLHLVILKN